MRQGIWFRLLRHSPTDPHRAKGLHVEYERKPNPLLGDAFAMVTGGGTLPVMDLPSWDSRPSDCPQPG